MIFYLGDRCSLVLDKVTQSDKGIYQVIARNKYGEAVSECTLHVEGNITYYTHTLSLSVSVYLLSEGVIAPSLAHTTCIYTLHRH